MHDILVVGAGPAGSIAALVLARAGLRVRIVDRVRFPREKLCGDTLNPGSLALLDRLDVSKGIRGRALAVTGMVVTGPGGTRVVGEYEDGLRGAALRRRELDLLLLEEAIRAVASFVARGRRHAHRVGDCQRPGAPRTLRAGTPGHRRHVARTAGRRIARRRYTRAAARRRCGGLHRSHDRRWPAVRHSRRRACSRDRPA